MSKFTVLPVGYRPSRKFFKSLKEAKNYINTEYEVITDYVILEIIKEISFKNTSVKTNIKKF